MDRRALNAGGNGGGQTSILACNKRLNLMVTNALCKLAVEDPELWKRWSCHIQTRMAIGKCERRLLSQILVQLSVDTV